MKRSKDQADVGARGFIWRLCRVDSVFFRGHARKGNPYVVHFKLLAFLPGGIFASRITSIPTEVVLSYVSLRHEKKYLPTLHTMPADQ